MEWEILLQDLTVSTITGVVMLAQVGLWVAFILYRFKQINRIERRWFVAMVILGFFTHRLLSDNLPRWLFGIGW